MRSLLLIFLLSLLTGCVATPALRSDSVNLPPIMHLRELNRTYRTVGRIQVNRTVYFNDYTVSPNLQEWGLRALQEEALKLDADAVIFAEVTSREHTITGFPSFPATEYRATGEAIKFTP